MHDNLVIIAQAEHLSEEKQSQSKMRSIDKMISTVKKMISILGTSLNVRRWLFC